MMKKGYNRERKDDEEDMKRWRPGVTVDVSDKTCSTPRLFTKAMWLPGYSTF